MADLRYPALYQIHTRVWVWFLSVWQTGPAAQAISRANAEWRKDVQETLPDLREEDIGGSGFAIQDYTVHRDLGGAAALARVRRRLQSRGLKLMLDFVPNHMAPDHPWIDEHPDWDTSSTGVATCHLWPNGTAIIPVRSP